MNFAVNFVQTFWSCYRKNLLLHHAGWLSPEYNLMSWALSCLLLKKHADEVTLYTDSPGANLLVNTLKLPYKNVVCSLDETEIAHPSLWALPKILTYSIQECPFLHVDGDIFIWKEFNSEFLNGNLITQNMEVATNYYENQFRHLETQLRFLPEEMRQERERKNPIFAYNTGLFGGRDTGFIKQYAEKAFEFVYRNRDVLSSINCVSFNIFFEQYLFYCLVKKNDKEVNVLFSNPIGDNEYVGFADFIDVPHKRQYLHLLGAFKRNGSVCQHLANRLRHEYPEHYYRIISLFKGHHIPLFKDYYWFVNAPTCESLLSRYKALKDGSAEEGHFCYDVTKQKSISRRTKVLAVIDNLGLTEPVAEQPFYNVKLKDLDEFEKAVRNIVSNKFSNFSRDAI